MVQRQRTFVILLIAAGAVLLGSILLLLVRNNTADSPITGSAGEAAPGSFPQKLRVENVGEVEIVDLIVVSPKDRITFGTIPAGGTSDYIEFPDGVYRYSAYEYVLDGTTIRQAVTDWVGEQPMPGKSFTYRIRLNLAQPPGNQIELVEVITDE